ncbi:MAG: hypothetical protein ACFB0E_02225 [Leptolyngbyaceae cyanobacterium]
MKKFKLLIAASAVGSAAVIGVAAHKGWVPPLQAAQSTDSGTATIAQVTDTYQSEEITVTPINLLTPGQDLERGTQYVSGSWNHHLVFEESGNLVIYERGSNAYVWGLDRDASSVADVGDVSRIARVSFQADGNLAAYDANGNWVWSALHTSPDPNASLQVTPEGELQLVSPSQGVLWASRVGGDSTVADSSTPEVETPEAVAEAPAPAGDVRTIGGAYTATDEYGYEATFDIPEGTQSDPNATFRMTWKGTGIPDETLTGTYDHPSLKIHLDGDPEDAYFPCIVADDAESMACELFTISYDPITFTRQ